MTDYRYTVYHVGVHTNEALELEKAELERVAARQIVLPKLVTEEEMIEHTRGADAMVIMESRVTRRVMEASPNCRIVLRTGVGVDTIDIDAATDRGIAVVNVPDLWLREVANHALALILACNRRLLILDRSVRAGNWSRIIPSPVGSLHDETLGLVGLGQIGGRLAKRAAALELNVAAFDPIAVQSQFDELGVERVTFEELLSRSDYISIHVPLTPETYRMFDEAAFRQMKSTAYIVNTSRGPTVDQEALVKALRNGWIAGAGLDVHEKEPPDADSPLFQMDNVVLTPHAGYYSDAALEAMAIRCGQEIASVLTGHMPRNLVNTKVLDTLSLKSR